MTGLFRVSTSETYRSGIENINDAQALLSRFQDQLATGKQILQPADDPVASAQVISLQSDLARLVDFQTNTDRASSTIAFSENAVAGAEDVLRQVRDLVIRAQNPIFTSAERIPLAAEVDGLLQQLLALGNSRSADGEYIFGGFSSNTQPYDIVAGVIQDNSFGDLGVREVNIADGIRVAVSDPGTNVFYAPPGNGTFTVSAGAGNTGQSYVTATTATPGFDQTQDYTVVFSEPTPGNLTWTITGSGGAGPFAGSFSGGEEIEFGAPGQEGTIKVVGQPAAGDTFQITSNGTTVKNAFSVLLDIKNALENSVTRADRAIADTTLSQSLQSIDQNLSQLSLVRTGLGVRLNRVEDQANLNSSFNLEIQKTVSSLEDIDYAETISQLQLQLVALQAAQQTFVKTTGLTIFNFL